MPVIRFPWSEQGDGRRLLVLLWLSYHTGTKHDNLRMVRTNNRNLQTALNNTILMLHFVSNKVTI